MLKLLKFSIVLLALLFIGVQFARPERVNPAFEQARAIEAHVHLNREVEAILQRSCKDCHSNQTVWPWYSNVAPVSWSVVDHVNHGRKHLNFSDWARYDATEADYLLSDICKTAKHGTMPLASYTLVHRDAKLSAGDVAALCDWSQQERERLASARHARQSSNPKLDMNALGRR